MLENSTSRGIDSGMKNVQGRTNSWRLLDFEMAHLRAAPQDHAGPPAQVDMVPVQSEQDIARLSTSLQTTFEEINRPHREMLVSGDDEVIDRSRRSSTRSGGWVGTGLDPEGPHQGQGRTANAEMVEDFMKAKRERSFSGGSAGAMDTSQVLQKRFERKPVLARRSYGSMVLAGVKAKIVRREPLAFSDTQEVSLSWFCGGLTHGSRLRYWCYRLYVNDAWRMFHLVLIILNCAAVALLPGLDPEPNAGGEWTPHDWWQIADGVCLVALGVEIAVGVIALGFVGSITSWFHCVEYHRLDLCVFVLAVLENSLAAAGVRTLTVAPFRLLRIFHVLSVATPLSGVRVMLQTLLQGAAQLLTVFATFLAITATLAIVGMAMYQRSFRRRCVWIEQWDDARGEAPGVGVGGREVVTGGYPFFQGCKIVYNSTAGAFDSAYPLDPLGRYHTCQLEAFKAGAAVLQMCEDVGNPDSSFGFGSFDHLGHALLVLLQSSLPDSFYDVLHASLQTEPKTTWLTWLFYFFVTGISTCLMLGLFVAVVTGTFKRVREESQFREAKVRSLKLQTLQMAEEGPPDGRAPPQTTTVHAGSFGQAQQDRGAWGGASEQEVKGGLVESNGYGGVEVSQFASAPHPRAKELVSDPRDMSWKRTVSRWLGVPVWALNGATYAVAIVNAATLATDEYNAGREWKRTANAIYIACSVMFCVEVALHAAAISVGRAGRSTLRSKRLWFKVVLCLLGVVGWAADVEVLKRSQGVWMYKLMRLMPVLELLVSLTVASIEHVVSVCIFVCIWVIAYAVTGRYLFGEEMDSVTRSNFGTMSHALLTVFQLFTGDSWSSVLYGALEATPNVFGHLLAAVFILSWVVLSQFLLNNLFIAVIIDKFKVSEVVSEQIRLSQRHSTLARIRTSFKSMWLRIYKRPAWAVQGGADHVEPPASQEGRAADMLQMASRVATTQRARVADESMLVSSDFSNFRRGSDAQASQPMRSVAHSQQLRVAMLVTHQASSVALFNHLIDYETTGEMMSAVGNDAQYFSRHDDDVVPRVLWVFGLEHPLRRFCIWLGQSRVFDTLVIVAIICSCLLLIITPRNDDIPDWDHVLSAEAIRQCSLGFTVLFTVEFVVRVMHHGLLLTPHAYLKSWWNQADLLILLFAWVDETHLLPSNGISKIFRLARAFRPLRLMKRNKGMRVLVDALLHALVPVSYVFLLSVFASAVFGLIGMGLFGGKLFSCSAPGAEYPAGKTECAGSSVQQESGILLPRAWVNAEHNFDSIWDACTTLLQVATLKYVAVMQSAMDVTGVDQSPSEDAAQSSALFFVTFIVCGRLFVYNLFVAFIVDGFYASRGSSQTSVAFGRLMRQLKIHKPPREDYRLWSNALSVRLRGVVQHRLFQTWSILCVFVNVLLMLTDHADPTPAFAALMWWQNLLFFVELCFEVLLQIVAYGPPAFIQDKWRVFDLAVAAGTAMGYVSSQREIANFAKSFRLARALRFMTLIRSVRIIFETLIACLPQLFNIFLLVVLVYSIFAAVAVQLFGVTRYGRRLGPTANFDTWSQAMQVCYQLLTGDEWMDLRTDCEAQPPFCTEKFDAAHVHGWEGPDLSFGDCGVRTAYLYFIAFKIFCEAVLLNLVIGMALDNFTFVTDDVSHEEDATWSQGASSDQVRQLATVFRRFDAGTGAIPLSFLPSLLHQLPRPLGFKEAALSPKHEAPAEATREPSSLSQASGRSEEHRRLLSPQVANDKLLLQRIRAELNCLVRDRRLAGRGERPRWEGWAGQGQLAAAKEAAAGCLGWKPRFREAVTFEEVMRTAVMWQLPDLVPEEVHGWRMRWVLDDVLEMVRVLAVRDWLVLRSRYKRKSREARLKREEARSSPASATTPASAGHVAVTASHVTAAPLQSPPARPPAPSDSVRAPRPYYTSSREPSAVGALSLDSEPVREHHSSSESHPPNPAAVGDPAMLPAEAKTSNGDRSEDGVRAA